MDTAGFALFAHFVTNDRNRHHTQVTHADAFGQKS